MLPFSYEDRFPDTQARHGYVATNEEPLLIREVVKSFKRGLGICSGGEVAFLALLPRTRESLVLIDHSYNSLKYFCLKALLLATLGGVETRRLLIDESPLKLRAATDRLLPQLPTSLSGPGVYGNLENESVNLRREWHYADLGSLRRSAANLHKIKLVHGDLVDTDDRAPYDFIYLSNALEHSSRPIPPNRTGTYPNVTTLSHKLMKAGSQILWVQAQGSEAGANKVAQQTWQLQRKVRGYRTSWLYNLSTYDGKEIQVPAAPSTPLAKPITPYKPIALGPS